MPLNLEPAPVAGAADAGAGAQHPLKPMEEPLAIAVLASAAGATTEIEDTEPPAHYCLGLRELGPNATSPAPDSVGRAPGRAPWPRRVRAALWRYRSMLLLATAVVALLAGGSCACVAFRSQLLAAGDYIRRHAPLSAVYYALIVAVWIVLCLPSTIIELASGLLYSYPVAIVCLTVGKQLGCGIAFLIGRWVTSPELRSACCLPRDSRHATGVMGGLVEGNSSSSKRSRTIQAMFLALEHHPWQITFLIRLLPIPISIKNYGMACLPRLSFYVFVICTLLAGIPFTVTWVYLGESCRSLLEALQGKGDDLKRHGAYVQELAFLITGLVVTVILVALLRRYTRRYTRLLAEREALAADAAAKAATQAGPDEQPELVLRSLGPRDVSTASTSTTLLTLARRRALTEDEAEEGEYEVGLEEGDCFDSDDGLRCTERQRRQRRRRRRSSGSTSSGLTVDVSSLLVEEGEGCSSLETVEM